MNRVNSQTHTSFDGDSHRLVDPGDLFDRNAETREVRASTAPCLIGSDAEETEVTHLPDDLGWEVVLCIPLRRVRCNAVVGELAHHGPKGIVFICEIEIHEAS